MTVAVVLLGYAALLGFAVPGPLRRARWARRAPRLAIAVWRAASVSALVSAGLAGLALATGWLLARQPAPFGHPVGPAARTAYTGAPAPALAALGAALTTVLAGRVACCLARQWLRTRREHRRHLTGLALLGRAAPGLAAVVVPGATPAVYCLPGRGRSGRGGRVVVSTAAVDLLDAAQLAAVLEHERAHLRARHHRRRATAIALARALPRVPLLAHAPDALTELTEMAADDAAAARHGRRPLAQALVRFGLAGAAPPALAAGGQGAVRRVERLLRPPAPLRLPARTLARLATTGLLAAPIPAACLPLAILTCIAAAS
jgi:Peptidase family M48